MTYATPADLEAAFGASELRALADRDRDGAPDPAVMTRALEDADAEINSYLAARYALPLSPVPAQIRAIACDVARHRLDALNPRDVVETRYRAALAALRDLSTGKATLGQAGAAASDPAAPAPPTTVSFVEGARAFGDDRLIGF
jgi:phage gp36-like protein